MSRHICAVFALLWIYNSLFCCAVSSINFVPTQDASKDSIIYITNKHPYTMVDASSSIPRTIYFAERSEFVTQTFTFACQVNPQSDALQRIVFCYRSSQTDEHKQCLPIQLDAPTGSVTALKTLFAYRVDRFRGVNLTVNLEKGQTLNHPIYGLFSCSITNGAHATISSNEVEIRDAVYYMRSLPTAVSLAVSEVRPIGPNDFPRAFHCADGSVLSDWPDWMHTLSGIFGIYEWGYCTVSGRLNAYTCTSNREGIQGDSAIVLLNGTLFILDKSFFTNDNRALVCKTKERNAPVRTFAGSIQTESTSSKKVYITGGISIDKEAVEKTPSLKPLTKLNQNYTMLMGSKLDGFSLTALYREPEGGSDFKWSKDWIPLPLDGASKFSYLLPIVADVKLDGVYQLKVTSKANPNDKLIFTYYLQITYPPFFAHPNCLASLLYIMRGGNYSIRCWVQSKSKTRLLVGVNDYEAETEVELRNKLKQERSLNRPLSELDIKFGLDWSAQRDNLGLVTVELDSMQSGQDFGLVMRLESLVGKSHIYSSLKVIPIPKLITSPESANCAENCDKEPYNVSCILDPELVRKWKEQYDISPLVSWVIQNQWMSEEFSQEGIGQFMKVYSSHGQSTLSVWPGGIPTATDDEQSTTKSPNKDVPSESGIHLGKFIADNAGPVSLGEPWIAPTLLLRCRIQLIVHTPAAHFSTPPGLRRVRAPSSSSLSSSSVSLNQARRMYDTTWETDATLVNQLCATRAFSQGIMGAGVSYAWIAGLVIGAIIIFIVIALSIWLFTRDRGETYMLYDKERAHGNDPIQEMKEAEGFKTYQRQEEQPLASSRYSLNDGSLHVESDDDGELDQYDANFNEEGSFIHGYTTDPALPRPISPPDVSVAGLRHSTLQNHNAV